MLPAAFALVVALHALLTWIGGPGEEKVASKPLTTQFVKRQPRLTKPLELRKQPRPRPRRIQRQMVAVKARSDRGRSGSRLEPVRVMERFARPSARLDRGHSWAASELEPETVAQSIGGAKETKEAVDLSLEMLDIQALNTGRYHAMVVQDPSDKRNVRGFFRLKYAYSKSMRERYYHNFENRVLYALAYLVEAVNRYTDVEATFEGRVSFDSAELLQTPWVYIQVGPYPFEMNPTDRESLGSYLTSGGFVFCDAHDESLGGALRTPSCLHSASHMLSSAIEGQGLILGRDWSFDRIADSHPIYHCFFDFEGLPGSWFDPQFVQSEYLRGAVINQRLVAVLSNKAIAWLWGVPDSLWLRNERIVQLGVNSIIFALTQEGSITRRVMDMIR